MHENKIDGTKSTLTKNDNNNDNKKIRMIDAPILACCCMNENRTLPQQIATKRKIFFFFRHSNASLLGFKFMLHAAYKCIRFFYAVLLCALDSASSLLFSCTHLYEKNQYLPRVKRGALLFFALIFRTLLRYIIVLTECFKSKV